MQGKELRGRGNYAGAISSVSRAIELIKTPGTRAYGDIESLVRCYADLSENYQSLGQTAGFLMASDSGIAIGRKYGMKIRPYLYALFFKTKYLFDIGDFIRCMEYAEEGEKDAKALAKAGGSPEDYYNNFLNFHVNSLLELKDFTRADKLLEHKVEEARNDRTEYVWRLYAQMARVEISRANYGKATFYYEQAFRNALAEKDTIGCLMMLENTGYYVYYLGSGDAKKALSYYRKALSFSKWGGRQSIGESLESLNLLTNIADAYVRLGAYDTAFHYFQLAFDQIGKGVNEGILSSTMLGSLASFDRAWFLTALVIDKGDALLRQYKERGSANALKDALAAYKAADKVLDRIKSEQWEVTSRLFWRSDSRRLYEHAIEASYLCNDLPAAFYFFEKSRSILLNDEINARRFLSKEDMLKQAQWKIEIQTLKQEAEGKNLSAARRTELSTELFQYTWRLDSLEKGIKGLADTVTITLQDVRNKLLHDHDALLELFAGDSTVYALQVTRGKTSLVRMGKTAFDSLSRSYIRYISNAVATNRDMQGWLHCSGALYELIFPGASAPAGRIIISPDGAYFPFETLVTAVRGNAPVYFLEDHVVSYTYSARYLFHGSAGPETTGDARDTPEDFMGMAPVQYARALQLPELPGSDGSLRRIGDHFVHPGLLLSTDATRNNFLRRFPGYRVVQLYTHAADNSQENGEPVIYFSDSALYLSALISGERAATRLIVLSACETGNGKISQGEGVFSFNRGFAALGIPSSLINLWSVDNGSTYALTESFYGYLAEGMPMDSALQKAKIEFLKTASKEKSLPYYWAATVLIGRTNALSFQKPAHWQWPLLLAALAGLIAWAVRRSLLRRKQQ